ncbi:MAG: ATP-dependent zinc metalloprotease FtsH [Deltaproteobacteria bacterium]|nr:ATP-dependent zinc metalloprotease FtsH [Deltaproteobacteria bacterium]
MERFPWQRALGLLLLLLLMSVMVENLSRTPTGPSPSVSYSTFKKELRDGNVQRVVLTDQDVTATLYRAVAVGTGGQQVQTIRTSLPPMDDRELLPLLEEKGVELEVRRRGQENMWWMFLVNSLPWLLLLGFWVWTMRRAQNARFGPFGSFGQVKAKVYEGKVPKVTFQDVAGMENPKRELAEIVDYLGDPERFQRVGGRVPKGILLMGPPGTGKTLMARAVAGEAGVPFFSTSASEFIEMFVGVGAARVRDLFEKARAKAPSIIFIDEIDAVGRSRGTGLGGGHDEREQTLNQLLGEMDGFEGHERVIVIAATNRPDVLDPALLRPGRFDRHVVIDLPTLEERAAILRIHTRSMPLAPDVDLDMMARSTPGMSGADLENLCNEAALFAARERSDLVTKAHFEQAKDKVLMGLERPGLTDENERRITAYHEAGHAVVARLIPGMDPVHKVTIVPRGAALGVTQIVPEADRHYYPKSYLLGKITVNMGGRAAELLVFDDLSTGAQNDLKQSTDLAEKMVCQWGMSERVGPVTFSRGEEHVFLGKKLAQEKTYSEQMGWIIDQEIETIVRDCEARAADLLKAHREALDRVAAALLEREELSGAEVDRLIAGSGEEQDRATQG